MEDKILNDILETVIFLKDNMVSKDDLAEGLGAVRAEMSEGLGAVHAEMSEGLGTVRAEMNEGLGAVRAEMNEGLGAVHAEMNEMKSDIMAHMDGFIGLHQKLDLELVSMRARYDRLEDYIRQLASHVNVELK